MKVPPPSGVIDRYLVENQRCELSAGLVRRFALFLSVGADEIPRYGEIESFDLA
jgi:hypothetical protein